MTVRGEGCMEDSHGSVHVQHGAPASTPTTAAAGQAGHPHHHHHHHHHHQCHQQQPESTDHCASSVRSNRLSRSSDQEEADYRHSGEHRSVEDDELPLGSEANSLGQHQDDTENNGYVVPPVDKRLLSLRQAGTGGGAQLLHSGWTSFNSDVSNLTSGSAQSNSSVEWLLQKRQEDPEQILFNLGFCAPEAGVMYSRVPERFLQTQEPEAVPEEDGTQQEGVSQEGAASPQRKTTPSRAAWGRVTSLASASLKLLSFGQQRSAFNLFPSTIQTSSLQTPSHYGSTPSLTPPGHPRSILNLENQRALALQGFYGDNLPEGLDISDLHLPGGKRNGAPEEENDQISPRSAKDRRKVFQKTRSKQRQRSLVESGEDEEGEWQHHRRQQKRESSNLKSVDFSTTTESTDSGGELSTAPTTPGDVFLDRTNSPALGGRGGNNGDSEQRTLPTFPVPLEDIDDLYIPRHQEAGSSSLSFLSPSSGGSGLSRTRQKLSDHLEEDGNNYFVLSPSSRQPTVEKASTLTDIEADRLEQELAFKYPGGAGSSREPRNSSSGGRERVSADEQQFQSLKVAGQTSLGHHKSKTVSIIVSTDDRGSTRHYAASPVLSKDSRGDSGDSCATGGSGGMSLLSVDSTNADRLSDSGSDLTLVEQQSSSSGGASPRLSKDRGSPRRDDSGRYYSNGVDNNAFGPNSGERSSVERSAIAGIQGALSRSRGFGGESLRQDAAVPKSWSATESGVKRIEQGPVLFVYHRSQGADGRPKRQAAPDENDNFPHKFKGDASHPENYDEDLPRMSSVQSDSSGFGDTEVSADSAGGQEMASLKVSSLGSSCESSATAISTSTIMANNNNSFQYSPFDTSSTQTQTDLHQEASYTQQSLRSEQHRMRSESTSARTGPDGKRYVTMCFIPNIKKAGDADSGRTTTTSSGESDTTRRKSVPKHYTVVFSQNADRTNVLDSSGGSGRFRSAYTAIGGGGGTREREVIAGGRSARGENRKNETPLSEEIAQASSLYNRTPLSNSQQQQHQQRFTTSSAAGLQTSTPRYPLQGSNSPSPAVPRLALHEANLGISSPEVGSSRAGSSGDELEDIPRSQLSYQSWRRELPNSAQPESSKRYQGMREGPRGYLHNPPSLEGDLEGSEASLEGSSAYSYASTGDSITTSGSSSEMLDCHKLMKLVNQPTVVKGRKANIVYYRPKRHLRYWSSLAKKKRLQEETRLAQYAIQKFKTELNMMETAATVRYQMLYDEMPREERADMEELQGVWAQVRHQLMETEQLLTQRMRAVVNGNDHFSPLATISVLQQLIELLKEQLYQKEVAPHEEDVEEDEDLEDWEEEMARFRLGRGGGGGYPRYKLRSRFASSSWADLPRSPLVSGLHHGHGHLPYSSSSTSHLPQSPAFSDQSYEQFRTSLLSDVREEMRSSLQTFQHDLQRKDNEIQRLQQQLLMRQYVGSPGSFQSRSPRSGSRSLPGSVRRSDVHETDV